MRTELLLKMHLALVTNWYPDGRPNSEYGPHLVESLRVARPDSRITVLAGAPGAMTAALPGVTVERAWRHGGLDVAGDLVRAVRRLRPAAVLFNASFNAWGGNVSNLSAFWGMARVARETRTVVLLHYLPQTLTGTARYRLAPWHWAGIHVACGLAARAQVVAFTLARDVTYFREHYKPEGSVHVEHGLLGPCGTSGFDEPDGVPGVLAFGYWGPGKDLEGLLRAVERAPNMRLIVAGTSHPRFPGFLEGLRERFGSPRVSFEGYVGEDDLPALFRRVRAVVLPYESDSGTSGVLHLAAQHGRAIIASDLPVIRQEATRLGLALGFYRDADGLASALQAVGDGARMLAEGAANLEGVRGLTGPEIGERWWRLIEGEAVLSCVPTTEMSRA